MWAPHTAQDINKIEIVRRRAARFVYKYYHFVSISSILESLGWPTLQARRNYLKLILTYKILKTMITIPPNNFTPVSFNTRGYQSYFQCLQTTCDSYRFSFFPSAIRLWNCLPTDIASIDDFNEFNMKLQQHLLTIIIMCVILYMEVCTLLIII